MAPDIHFEFAIFNSAEAVFSVGGEQRIYDIDGINYLSDIYADNESIMEEIEQARIAMFNVAAIPVR